MAWPGSWRKAAKDRGTALENQLPVAYLGKKHFRPPSGIVKAG
jgi:hypothetical protein